MSQKFGRSYRLTLYPIDGGEPIIITLPFTINFTLNRHQNATINTLSIDIYNLSEDHRRRLFQDLNVLGQYADNQLTPDGKNVRFFNILLEAGYSQLYRIFYGRMTQASSAREGTNIITHIEATSSLLDLTGTQIQATLAAGATLKDVLLFLVAQFPNLAIGAIGDYPQVFSRPVVLNGNCWRLLKEYSGGTSYIDSGKIYILNNNEMLPAGFVINDATGILQTPRRQLNILNVVTLMETGIDTIGQQVQIQSSIQQEYNGTYKVLGICHQGTISAAVCGRFRSSFVLQATGLFNGFNLVSPASATP